MYNNYNPYNPYFNNQQIQNRYQPIDQAIGPKPMGLNGKVVDSIDTVKGMDINLDGTVSYFPLADGSKIITKQLNSDGTSKIVIYSQTKEDNKEVKYITSEELDKAIKKIDLSDIKDDIKSLKKQIKELRDNDE
jgi:hypothetical protein